ncbi:MAG: alpha/beta hydrolase, partial [Proteobacteria bacterium]
MAGQWTTEKLKSWVTDTTRQVKDSGFGPLLKLQERFTDLHGSTRARIGSEVANRALALGRQLIKAELGEVQLKDGPISYWKTNNTHPETILFIHGFGDSKDGCYPFAMHLTRSFNMMAFDLPGFGSSFKNTDLVYNFDTYAAWMEEFIEKIGVGPVHVIGNSLGGAMAMKLAQVRPDIVKTLTLIDTAAVIDDRYDSAYDDFINGKVMFQIKSRQEFDLFWKCVFNKPPFMPIFMKDHIYEQFRSNYDLYGRFIHDIFRDIKSRVDPGLTQLFMNNALAEMKMPIHIIWGDQDRLFPLTYGQRAHELVKGSEFTVMKDIGHAPQVEAPAAAAKH